MFHEEAGVEEGGNWFRREAAAHSFRGAEAEAADSSFRLEVAAHSFPEAGAEAAAGDWFPAWAAGNSSGAEARSSRGVAVAHLSRWAEAAR